MLTQAAALTSALTLHIAIQGWSRTCKSPSNDTPLSCALPTPLKSELKLEKAVALAEKIGDTRVSKLAFGDKDFGGEIRFYSTVPKPESGYPAYIQIQVETLVPVRALCIQSVRLRKPFEASPITCTGLDTAGTQQVGVNVKVSEVPPSLLKAGVLNR